MNLCLKDTTNLAKSQILNTHSDLKQTSHNHCLSLSSSFDLRVLGYANRLSSSTQAVKHICYLLPTTAPKQSCGASLAGYQQDKLPLWHHKVHLAVAFSPLHAHPTLLEPFFDFFISSTQIPAVSACLPAYFLTFYFLI